MKTGLIFLLSSLSRCLFRCIPSFKYQNI